MKLTESEKKEIYEMYLSGNYHLREIAEWIGCSIPTVIKVIRNEKR